MFSISYGEEGRDRSVFIHFERRGKKLEPLAYKTVSDQPGFIIDISEPFSQSLVFYSQSVVHCSLQVVDHAFHLTIGRHESDELV